jgi:hypothetical protein
VTEETRFTGPTSRRSPGRAQNGRPSPFEGSAVLLRGCCAPAIREWAAQCLGGDPSLTAQYRTVAGMASPGELAELRRDMIPRRVRGTACVDLSASVRALSAPVGGAGTGATSLWEPQARRRLARGGDQPSSEADLTRGGVRPSSEAELHPRGLPALERGGVSLVRCGAPRAKRSFARGGLGRLSWWVAGATRAVGPCHWAVITSSVFWVYEFVCASFFTRENGFPPFLGDPYGCPRQ